MSIFNNARVWQGATIISGAGLWWIKREADRERVSLQVQSLNARNDATPVKLGGWVDEPLAKMIPTVVRMELLEATHEIMRPYDLPRFDASIAGHSPPDLELVIGSNQTFLRQLLREINEIGEAMETLREENAKLKRG